MTDMDCSAVDRLFDALGAGDVAAATACLTADARVWHGFDGIAQTPDEAARGWAGFIAAFPERAFVDARRQVTATGCVQQHMMVARLADGSRKAWPVCVVIRIERGLIARLDEYIDPAGAFAPDDDAVLVTPGL